ncbi:MULTISPECIES: fatty acid desaturase [Prochlorococcus]|uniref:Fatty acid desaturase n=2 Tax=Prochlorococcus TaxID=1218 RepID=Q7VB84_PROMA|nr:Fatty acid desaturase [Prochlorococcus marinus subsp. marinus str. CCMP1375]KGG19197.1 Fatty acid desaturase [Prochlorococcus marinus str. SS2]KGG32502.1 Fatty acid desaturase [Prochlorococcus marinus str. SS51]
MSDIPTMPSIAKVIPRQCFTRQTSKSLAYLFRSILIQVIVVAIGLTIPYTPSMSLVWIIYALVSGTTAMGFWVIAHECGHGAFSNNRRLETVIGYFLHTILLVPYFSWQRSHSVHHRFTNHITEGETHVPLVIGGNGISEQAGGEEEIAFSRSIGKVAFGAMQLLMHLIIGWPAYLLAGKTGGPKYGMSNHFWPREPFSKKLWPSTWSKKVWKSDCGIAVVLIILFNWAWSFGIASVLTMYVGPLLVVNCWLVVYTWLHHTDSDVPHLGEEDFSFMRGAFLSIDRPYGKILDFLHHHIGSTHVIHHIAPTIPHYHAIEATRAIKKAFPKVYLFNPTPIHKALWSVASNCVAVKADGQSSRYLWEKNLN